MFILKCKLFDLTFELSDLCEFVSNYGLLLSYLLLFDGQLLLLLLQFSSLFVELLCICTYSIIGSFELVSYIL
jgi:hypothetical protein